MHGQIGETVASSLHWSRSALEGVSAPGVTVIQFHRPAEQHKIERLHIKLAKTKPVNAQPAPIAKGEIDLKTA